MRSSLTLFAAACAASFALSTSAGAASLLTFGENTSTPQVDFVRATVSGNTTTLNTVGPAASPTSIPVTLGQVGILSGPAASALPAFETFLPALSSTIGNSGGTQFGFNGTIIFSSLAGGTGTNYLTAVVQNGVLRANGAAGTFDASDGSTNGGLSTTVTLTSGFQPVILAMGGSASNTTFSTPGAVAIGLSNITPLQSGASFVTFTSTNGGTLSSLNVIPEPASFLSASTAILAGLGCFGWSRRKSSKA